MKSRLSVWAGLCLMLAWPVGAEQRFIVRARADKIDQIAARHGLSVLHTSDARGIAILVDRAGRSPFEVLRQTKSDQDVENVEPDGNILLPEHPLLNQSTVAILDAVPSTRNSTTYYSDNVWDAYVAQPAAGIIRLADAQKSLGAVGSGIVAVIDTGIDASHPALSGHVILGKDFFTGNIGMVSDLPDLDQSTVAILDSFRGAPLPAKRLTAHVNQSTVAILDQSTVAILDKLQKTAPAFGHGTMVAGLVHLVAPNAQLLPLRAFRADGTGTLSNVVLAIYHAVDRGAKVINMSFSMDAPSQALQDAIAYANSNKVICISSAGNSGKAMMVYPAGYKQVEGIGSTNNRDVRSSFSNYGDLLVGLAAPGENLITTYPGGNWAAVSGTSFSTALVSGASALVVQLDRDGTNQSEAEDDLEEAKPLPNQGLGAGRLDLFRVCQAATADKRRGN